MPSDYKKTRYSEESNLLLVFLLLSSLSLISSFLSLLHFSFYSNWQQGPLTAIMRYEGILFIADMELELSLLHTKTNTIVSFVHDASWPHRSASGLLSHSSSIRTRCPSSSPRSRPWCLPVPNPHALRLPLWDRYESVHLFVSELI